MSVHVEAIGAATQPVTESYELDAGAARHRIGLIALATDEATERDFHRMLPDDEVMFYTSRVQDSNPVTVENLRKMGPRLTESASQLLPGVRLDVIAYSCTSGSVALGYDKVAEQIRAGRPDVPVVTPITAALAGFEKLEVRKISLLTPYIDSVNQAMRRYLEEHGVTVLNMGGFCLESSLEMARLPPQAIQAAALEIHRPDADAVFISCTAIRAAETLESLERDLGKPVLSSNQCLFWESLRLSGYTKPIEGFGQLMRH